MDNNEGEAVVDDYTLRIAEMLHDAQEQSGLSYTVLAGRTGLGRATIERVLNGKRPITANYLRLLCRELGLSPSEVLDRAEADEDA